MKKTGLFDYCPLSPVTLSLPMSSKNILLFGAGKSATVLISYLKELSIEKDWTVTVADMNLAAVQAKVGEHPLVKAKQVNLENEEERSALVAEADVVISLLPPSLQFPVAKDCLEHGKHFLSASYIDPEIQLLAKEIEQKGILFLCEMGLDPGIDHMSAMKMIHEIQAAGGYITSFRSHCGGLVAPESDDNCWHYKFTWNPRNVVVAGKAGAVYKENSTVENLDYADLFSDCEEVDIEGIGALAFYYNRDSLSYIPTYQLSDAATFVRTTLRYPVFCKGWEVVIALGLTNETNSIQTDSLTISSFFEKHIKETGVIIPDALKEQFAFIGLIDHTMINKGHCSSADVLQWILEKRWALQPEDKDMIVMLHEIEYEKGEGGQVTGDREGKKIVRSLLIVKGGDNLHTAMAKTVGLPLGIAARLILEGDIKEVGLHIPILPGIYEPVLKALEKRGIVFKESTHPLS